MNAVSSEDFVPRLDAEVGAADGLDGPPPVERAEPGPGPLQTLVDDEGQSGKKRRKGREQDAPSAGLSVGNWLPPRGVRAALRVRDAVHKQTRKRPDITTVLVAMLEHASRSEQVVQTVADYAQAREAKRAAGKAPSAPAGDDVVGG
jgi:hypothetical protein